MLFDAPNVNVCPGLLSVKPLSFCEPDVINKLFVILEADILNEDVVVPVIVPLVEATGKVTVPVKLKLLPAPNAIIPAV